MQKIRSYKEIAEQSPYIFSLKKSPFFIWELKCLHLFSLRHLVLLVIHFIEYSNLWEDQTLTKDCAAIVKLFLHLLFINSIFGYPVSLPHQHFLMICDINKVVQVQLLVWLKKDRLKKEKKVQLTVALWKLVLYFLFKIELFCNLQKVDLPAIPWYVGDLFFFVQISLVF